MQEKAISLSSLASNLGIPEEDLSPIVNGDKTPSISEIELIANKLSTPPYWLLIPLPNFLASWHISIEELGDMIKNNPSLRGFMVGYMAESKIRSYFLRNPDVSNLFKPDDHDRTNKCDLVLSYKGRDFTFEIKSLQTNTVRKIADTNELTATFQCDASDRRIIELPNGHSVNTTCLKFGDFDIVAINLFAFTGNWDYAFALNRDLPHASQGRGKNVLPKEDLSYLIKSSIRITYPTKAPFVDNPFVLMDQLLQENH